MGLLGVYVTITILIKPRALRRANIVSIRAVSVMGFVVVVVGSV
jgi:hypothetical protein